MKYNFSLFLVLTVFLWACSEKPATEETAVKKNIETPFVPEARLKTDFPDRVYKFRVMPDSTVEQQVIKYEAFAALFIEYSGIYKNEHRYAPEDQENNVEAYAVLRDELVAIKNKLQKNITKVNKDQEKRLDDADARMNAILPNVYKEDAEKK
jgi:hypothetical protein